MKTINRYFFLILLTFGIIISTVPITMAQTPDGETPAVEDVCDGLEGKAYGLCNAYCEAKDCEEAAEDTGHESCQRLKENYFDLTGEDIFPCEEEQFECPCLVNMIEAGDSLEAMYTTYDSVAPTDENTGNVIECISNEYQARIHDKWCCAAGLTIDRFMIDAYSGPFGSGGNCLIILQLGGIELSYYSLTLQGEEAEKCLEEISKIVDEDNMDICE